MTTPPPEDYQTYAQVADYAYNRNKMGLGLENYEQLDDFRDSHHIAFKHKYKDDIILGIRGTDDASDIGTDVFLGLGLLQLTSRYKKSIKKLEQLKKEHPKANIKLAGHSLGASIVKELANKYDLEGHVFNPGSHIYNSRFKNLPKKKHKHKIHTYITGSDPISNSSALSLNPSMTHVIPSKHKNPHSIRNFL